MAVATGDDTPVLIPPSFVYDSCAHSETRQDTIIIIILMIMIIMSLYLNYSIDILLFADAIHNTRITL